MSKRSVSITCLAAIQPGTGWSFCLAQPGTGWSFCLAQPGTGWSFCLAQDGPFAWL